MPFLLIQKREAFANPAAIYAYYFLVIGVINQFKVTLKRLEKER